MFHFISGLPRAGSTLLASILNQNPACSASIMSPVGQIVTDALLSMSNNEASSFITEMQRRTMLQAIVSGYYWDNRHRFIFDNNRRWTANAAPLAELYPESKIVCCLRDPAAVVDSFERLFQQNPLILSVIYGGTSNTTVYDRVREIMKPTGVVGYAINAFRSAFYGPHRDRLVLVEYDDLARFPAQIMAELTETLALPAHNYNFEAIEQIPGAEQFDQDVSTPGLHTLQSKVVYTERRSVLPPDVWKNLPQPFWRVKEEVTPTA